VPQAGAALWPDVGRRRALDVLGIGQISLDRVWLTETAPTEAERSEPAGLPEFSGGQVATAMLSLARLGLRTAYVGAVGADLDTEDPEAAAWAADVAHAAGIPVVLDAGPPEPAAAPLLAKVDFAIVSREFAEAFAGGSAREALPTLAARARRLAVVTLGEGGAIAQARGDTRVLESPGFAVEARDTTGAGDVFHAAFLWALLEGRSAAAVLRAANAAAAISCRGLGAQGRLPDREELASFLRAHREDRGAPGGDAA
jgi:sugar/nucleoside kinase (ribokinase family)